MKQCLTVRDRERGGEGEEEEGSLCPPWCWGHETVTQIGGQSGVSGLGVGGLRVSSRSKC